MRTMNRLAACTSVLAACLFASSAQAIPLAFSFSGTVGIADPGNAFGLASGDAVQVSGQFDSSLLTGTGAETVSFGLGSGNQLTVTLGAISLVETDDVDFDTGLPELEFMDGVLVDVDVVTSVFFTNAPADLESASLGFFAVDVDGAFIDGAWNADTFTTRAINNPIPEPATLTLLGVAALATGAARRRARA